MFFASLPLIFLFAGASICLPETMPESSEHSREQANPQLHLSALDKRSLHYDFGLGKRAYSYVSEYKRLPVYNFGLGKRSRPYSFGLGKRSAEETDQPAGDGDLLMDNAPDYQDSLDDLLELYDLDDSAVGNEKRARPYSFGLGKRYYVDEQNKRTGRYGFGLGKRLPHYNFGLGKRGRYYDFGLGKRYNKFNFGLGKRGMDLHRFNFGLGKRFDDNMENDADIDES